MSPPRKPRGAGPRKPFKSARRGGSKERPGPGGAGSTHATAPSGEPRFTASNNPRIAAVEAIISVLHGRALSDFSIAAELSDRDRALAREIATGSIRFWFSLGAWVGQATQQPFARLQPVVQAILVAGAYQLHYLRTPDHAAVSSQVRVAQHLLPRAAGLINAVLRRLAREGYPHLPAARAGKRSTGTAEQLEVRYDHPAWLIKRLQSDWPDHWESILRASLSRAPMAIRINPGVGRDRYRDWLTNQDIGCSLGTLSPYCLYLDHPVPSHALPDYGQAASTIQDEGAQLAARWLAPERSEHILDACAAPGNKTSGIMELAPGSDIVAVDIDDARLQTTARQLRRHIAAYSDADECPTVQCITADATTAGWWTGRPFDRILLDAPCSATGALRRHPDIKLLRRETDLTNLPQLQSRLLSAVWRLLRPGGVLVYCTCSVMRSENDAVISRFLATNPDARLDLPALDYGLPTQVGRQLLPVVDRHDGFFLSRLTKTATCQHEPQSLS